MELSHGFPGRSILIEAGYNSREAVEEATDDELLQLDGISFGMLANIRDYLPYKPSVDETGSGATSKSLGGIMAEEETTDETTEETSVEDDPTAYSYEAQTSGDAEDQNDVTGQPLPEGIVRNARGTLSASSEVDQPDFVSPKKLEEQRQAQLRASGERIAAALGQ